MKRHGIRWIAGLALGVCLSLSSVAPAQDFSIRITSPTLGSVVNQSSVLVRGQITALDESDVSVSVNEIAADAGGGQFGVFVPLNLGINTISATMVDSTGQIATDAVMINVETVEDETLVLQVSASGGPTPLTVEFTVANYLSRPILWYDLDFEGDGVVSYSSSTFEGVSYAYPSERLYFPTLTVIDASGGQTRLVTRIINTLFGPIERRMMNTWDVMKNALRNGNIDQALQYIAYDSRARYRRIFEALRPQLPEIDTILTDLVLVKVDWETRYKMAEFAMVRMRGEDRLSFYVRWIQDRVDGVWRIRMF